MGAEDGLDGAEFLEWAERIRTELVPKIEGSSATVSILPTSGELDVQFAVELGLSILLDKPIIALVTPGSKAPAKLMQVADRIIEVDLTNDYAGARARIVEALEEILPAIRERDDG